MAHLLIRYRTPPQFGLLERFYPTLKHDELYSKLYLSRGRDEKPLEAFHAATVKF